MINRQYEEARNSLIRSAEKYADQVIRNKGKGDWSLEWNRAFHARMNELAQAAKLIKGD